MEGLSLEINYFILFWNINMSTVQVDTLITWARDFKVVMVVAPQKDFSRAISSVSVLKIPMVSAMLPKNSLTVWQHNVSQSIGETTKQRSSSIQKHSSMLTIILIFSL
jgi:hypothetical protein